MKISAETLAVMKNYSKINPSMIFHDGSRLKTVSMDKNLKVETNIPDVFPRRFGVYIVNRLIQILSTFKEPELDFSDNYLTIHEGNRQVRYAYAEEEILKIPMIDKDINVPDTYEVFKLSKDAIADLERAYSILKMPDIVLTGDGKNIYYQNTNVSDPSSDVYAINVADTTKTFRAVFKAETFSKIVAKDYTLTMSDKGVHHLVADDGNSEYYLCNEIKYTKFK